jgi:transcriptional regulator with XRE-family HTH domain
MNRRISPFMQELRSERIRQRVTQWELAKRAGYQSGEIWRWENGEHQPRLDVVVDLANALGKHLVLIDKEKDHM